MTIVVNTIKRFFITAFVCMAMLCHATYAECGDAQKMYEKIENAGKDMSESLTPWGAEADLNAIRSVWGSLIAHLRVCEACRLEIAHSINAESDADVDVDIQRSDEIVRGWIREQQEVIERQKRGITEAFDIGWKIGAAGAAILGGLLSGN